MIKKELLLHSCCAPCLAGVFPQIDEQFELTVFWYNPNIWPNKEHQKRYDEFIRFCRILNIKTITENYDYQIENQKWQKSIAGLELEPEGGERCEICYRIRFEKTATKAIELNFNLFASELSISPHKNSKLLNLIGFDLSKKYSIEYYENNFKKNNGFLKSVENSKKYNLYRQNYCGCRYSVGE
jgi:predicted adenine nucleotide alpha hydrolase (AANH) superfamily ATPase